MLTLARVLMLEKGLSGRQLSCITGICQPDISKVTSGRMVPYPSYATKIAHALGWYGDEEQLFRPIKLNRKYLRLEFADGRDGR